MGKDPPPTSWPALAYETLPWIPVHVGPMAATAPSPYRAAIVPLIASRPIALAAETSAIVAEATAEIVRFDAETHAAIGPFASILLRSESAASSQIENLTAAAKAILMAEAGDTSRRNATIVAANVATMRAAVDLADRLTSDTILAMHTALLGRQHVWAGSWRTEQVWIGANARTPVNASFVPPHHTRVPAAIDDLEQFMARRDVAAFALAMIAHAQFETIHPFADGNGRTGRALIHAILRNTGITRNLTVPVSAGLLTNTDRYIDALTAYRSGDINPIVHLGAHAAITSIGNGRELADDITAIRSRWADAVANLRSDALARRVLDHLVVNPVIDANDLVRHFAVSFPTASTAIMRLAEAGVVQRANAGLRFRKWIAGDIADALDRFADRAGRRG